jgi:polar amino acid transport system substrate-binding protein
MDRRAFLYGAAVLSTLGTGRAAAAGSAIDEIKQRGTLRAGLSTFVPWAMRDKQGSLIGYELDVAGRLAKDLGVKHEPVPTAWDGIIPALLAGNFDLIIGGMTITPQRAETVDFTEPYSFTGVTLVASKKAAGGLKTLEAFNRPDFTITGRRGSSAVQAAQQRLPGATLRQFDDDAQSLQEVLNGNAQAMIATTPRPNFAALDHPNDLYLPLEKPFIEQRDAMALRKGDAKSVQVINDWIAARKADGWLPERFHYWFETREWLPLVAQN